MVHQEPHTVKIGTLDFCLQVGERVDNLVPWSPSKNTTILTINEVDPSLYLGAIYLLVAANHGPLPSIQVTAHYHDNGTPSIHHTTDLSIPDWQSGHLHQIRHMHMPCTANTGATAAMFAIPIYVDPSRSVRQLTLPNNKRLHIFGATGITVPLSWSSQETGSSIRIIDAQATFDNRVKVTVHNVGTKPVGPFRVHIEQHGYNTVQVLAPGHWTHVMLVCQPPDERHMTLRVHAGGQVATFPVEFPSTIDKHEAPQWLQNAKFGIFFHWGIYSVPAWAPVGLEYSEWYWWQMNNPNDPTYRYHRDNYGEDFNYDDFVHARELASSLNTSAWLELVDDAHAHYFVFTTKHHDGFALWDTSTTNRSTMHLGPKRDIVNELVTAARRDYPHLKTGLYFSLPEWYHPQFDGSDKGWAGGPPRNPYTGKEVPYTGYRPIQDFVNELQVPQALELIDNYRPDIFWCDQGGFNNSTVWQKHYFENYPEVAVNDRCGNEYSDFSTVEYHRSMATADRFWEATRGVDPYSFGFNRATPREKYASASELLVELVDVVAAGGNLLLNVGPDETGIVPEPMTSTLKEMGRWIEPRAEAIFNTTLYWVSPNGQDVNHGVRLRFTIDQHQSLYMFVIVEKGELPKELVVDVPLPLPLARIVSLPHRFPVTWSIDTKGRLVIYNTNDGTRGDEHNIWLFKIIPRNPPLPW
ncbi:glycoside hydrolase [Lichtheimia hyalospora FSU 10163]|nr:glycoside hydrolase [Lichtheimia hyalospora FSU 10163]